jgi:hypothetical protein
MDQLPKTSFFSNSRHISDYFRVEITGKLLFSKHVSHTLGTAKIYETEKIRNIFQKYLSVDVKKSLSARSIQLCHIRLRYTSNKLTVLLNYAINSCSTPALRHKCLQHSCSRHSFDLLPGLTLLKNEELPPSIS